MRSKDCVQGNLQILITIRDGDKVGFWVESREQWQHGEASAWRTEECGSKHLTLQTRRDEKVYSSFAVFSGGKKPFFPHREMGKYKHTEESFWGHLVRVAIAQIQLYRKWLSEKSSTDLIGHRACQVISWSFLLICLSQVFSRCSNIQSGNRYIF